MKQHCGHCSLLERVYGKVRNPDENPPRTETNGDGRYISTEELVQSYENRLSECRDVINPFEDRL